MSYAEAKAKYAALGIDTDAAIRRLKTVPVALHCWQGDDVRGFDTDPTKPLTGGIQTTGNYPGRARTPEELMADMDMVLKLCPGTKKMKTRRRESVQGQVRYFTRKMQCACCGSLHEYKEKPYNTFLYLSELT